MEAKVHTVFILFNLLWECPICGYENNTDVDRKRSDMHKDVHAKCEQCDRIFKLNTSVALVE